ncbi:hypothetical protein J6590_040143 [Homalodisca vitripennis]|nr:hypothetical protein J6590_040143 [Homalodisca vitripennis]
MLANHQQLLSTESARPFADRMFQPSTSAGYPSPEDVRPLQKAALRKETTISPPDGKKEKEVGYINRYSSEARSKT